jgi:hypothetical protein
MMKTTHSTYKFTLREQTEFQGSFHEQFIKIKPESLNGKPVRLDIEKLLNIRRVDDPLWAPPKFKYFVFELSDGVKISGKPTEKVCSVEAPFEKECHIQFDNMIAVEKIG